MTWLLIATWILPGHTTPEMRQYSLRSEQACLQEIARLRAEVDRRYSPQAIEVSAQCIQQPGAPLMQR
jgi:hypothetical protein